MSNQLFIVAALICMALWIPTASAAKLTVAKNGNGMYTGIQQAINNAGPGDEVVIVDDEIYEEQVTIDSTKTGLTLRSSNILNRPIIRYRDTINVHPINYAESQSPEKINYYINGALRIIGVKDVTIEGIIIDGERPFVFCYEMVWNSNSTYYALFHGNSALVICRSGDVSITNCEIVNSFFGTYITDRNAEGVYAPANSADYPISVRGIPWSGFAKTGNNIIEKNRIHHNTWGIFFEASWNLGSTIRYNLFYENHHATDSAASFVRGISSEGLNHPGGAILFKDNELASAAIYNNTFWHNYLIFGGNWKPGSQQLIFNNIYGEPNIYWTSDKNYPSPFISTDPVFINRMKHCVYACQNGPVKIERTPINVYDEGIDDDVVDTFISYSNVRIMNGLPLVEPSDVLFPVYLSSGTIYRQIDNVIVPGNRILSTAGKAFPSEANIRWLETRFKSTDPLSPDFLIPDWNDEFVKKFILDQGWPDAGVYDKDGTIADLGAIPFCGQINDIQIKIRPVEPVFINENKVTVKFDLFSNHSGLKNLSIAYCSWVNLKYQPESFASSVNPMNKSDIIPVKLSSSSVKIGSNTVTFVPPIIDSLTNEASIEMIISGETSDGQRVSSEVAFIPYKKSSCYFNVELWDSLMINQITKVKSGMLLVVVIKPMKLGTLFTEKIAYVKVDLSSGFPVYHGELDSNLFISSISGTYTAKVRLPYVPKNGYERILVSGAYEKEDYSVEIFKGCSDLFSVSSSTSSINPGNGRIKMDKAGIYEKIQLIDLHGRVIRVAKNIKCTNDSKIFEMLQVRNLSPGVYVIRMKDLATGKMRYRRLLR